MITENATAREDSAASHLDLLKIPQETWRPFEAEQQRMIERVWEREISRIPGWIRSDKHPEWTPVQIWDYSPLGFGLHYPHVPGYSLSAWEGQAVEFKLQLPDDKEISIPCMVQNTSLDAKGIRIGLTRVDFWSEEKSPPEAIKVLWDAAYPLSARIANPFLYNEWASARLVGLTSGRSWVFESSDMALLLLPGHPLRILFDLPLEGSGGCSGDVLWTRLDGTRSLLFAVRWSVIPFEVSNALGEYLLQTGASTPRELGTFGIRLKRFKERLSFAIISREEDYLQVLSLRKETYLGAGKLSSPGAFDELADRYDPHSLILAAFHGETVVATITLTYAPDDSFMLRTQGEFPDHRYPIPMPPKTNMIEAHSMCTHKDYRGGDLLRSMVEFAGRCLLLSDRQWIVTFSSQEMLPFYQGIGGKDTGVVAPIKLLNDIEHHLILLQRNTWVHGAGMNPLIWNYFFGQMVRDLRDRGCLELTPWRAAWLSTYQLLGGISRKWVNRRFELEYRKFLENLKREGGDD